MCGLRAQKRLAFRSRRPALTHLFVRSFAHAFAGAGVGSGCGGTSTHEGPVLGGLPSQEDGEFRQETEATRGSGESTRKGALNETAWLRPRDQERPDWGDI